MQIPVTNTFIWAVAIISVVVAVFVLRALHRTGVYWVSSWFTVAPGSGILIVAVCLWARQADGVLVRTLFGTLFVVALASGLFFMKVTNLRAYSSLELLFAAAMATKAMHDLKPDIPPTDMLTIGTSAYLIIRGMDNFKKDLDIRKAAPAPARAVGAYK